MATTTNFGWETPDDTDLVKDGALAMRTLGNAIDASLVDLKGGTTGQVLSKTSNTDMDFTWVTSDDANAIQNAIVDAKGDLITATAADTPARLAVGSNGETLVADSAATTGLRWQGNFASGKNKIINGDFRINQRNFTSGSTDASFIADRMQFMRDAGGTVTASLQQFTPGTAPVAGYEAINFGRLVTSGQTATSTYTAFFQKIEDVRTFAGQTVTLSFWAKANSGTPKLFAEIGQIFNSVSPNVNTSLGQVTISTSWARYSLTVTVPSIAGTTIGAGSNLYLSIWVSAGSDFNARTGSLGIQSNTFDIWGWQLEAGSVATAFQTATGTLQGELAACQRYYFRNNALTAFATLVPSGLVTSATNFYGTVNYPVQMRAAVTSVDFANLQLLDSSIGTISVTAATLAQSSNSSASLDFTISGGTTGRFGWLRANNTTSAYIGFSAEL